MKGLDSIEAVVVGPADFAESLMDQGSPAHLVSWTRPSAVGALKRLLSDDELSRRVTAANEEALSRITSARCRVIDVKRAGEAVSGLERGTLLHAGPPLDWQAASGPMRGALAGAVLYEGWAPDLERAENMLSREEIKLYPCHEHDAVGPMAGVISPSMPVFVVVNETYGNTSFSTINEGLGKVLRYGANDQGVLDHLTWIAERARPLLGQSIRDAGGVDLTSIIAQALHMGDELHNRNKAATALFAREIAGSLCHVGNESQHAEALPKLFRYLATTDVFFLNLAMAACKAALDSAIGIEHSTLITVMARNGTEFGIWLSGSGRRWFTAPAPEIDGLFFPGYSAEDANPDLGDSAITETGGLGGFALAGAPGIVQFVGGSVSLGRQITHEMYEITAGEHPIFQIPALDFRGTPIGIDAARVCRTGISPVLDTGIAHKEAGIGQIGAGIVRVPREPFAAALESIILD